MEDNPSRCLGPAVNPSASPLRLRELLFLLMALNALCTADAATGDAALVDARGIVLNNDHSEKTIQWELGLQLSDLPAKLRFRVSSTAAAPPWEIRIKSKLDSLTIDSHDALLLVGVPNAYELLVDDTAPVAITLTKDAPDLIYDSIVRETASQTPLFIISRTPHPLYFNGGLKGDNARIRLGRSIVRLDFDIEQDGYVGETYCTGFQIAPGEILTNLHCIDSPLRPIDHRKFTTIRYGVDDQHPNGEAWAVGTVVKIGHFNVGRNEGGLDFAVLKANKIVETFRSDLVDINNSEDPSNVGSALEVYEMWSGVGAFGAGKALISNDECMTGSLPDSSGVSKLNNAACSSPDFLHGCDAQGGSSGSPIFLRGTNKLIGLHFGEVLSTVGNCAVSISAVKRELGK